jgi:hypothetical protein
MQLSRRSVLRGAGAALALPMLDAMLPRRAFGASEGAKPPLRMGIFTVTGGTVLESWKPKTDGKLDQLPSILRPLEFAKDELLVLSGLSQDSPAENLNGHEHAAYLHLTCAEKAGKKDGKSFASTSFDQLVAEKVGEETYLPSLEFGLSSHETRYSFANAETPIPYENNPRLVFERMFRGRRPTLPDFNPKATQTADAVRSTGAGESLDRSVLDLVKSEADGLMRKLGQADRRRVDEYLAAVRGIEKKIAFLEQQQRADVEAFVNSDEAKTLVLPKNLPLPGLHEWQISQPVMRDPEKHGEYIRVMSDLMVLAFQTDTTRVVTFAAGSDEALFPGVVTVGYERHCHTLEHQGNAGRVEDADPIAREACRQIHEWYTMLFAEMVRKLRDVQECGEPLLNHCMLMYTSYMADGGHGRDDYPLLLAGKANGLLNTGRHLVFPQRTPVANLYLEMMHRMGVKADRFGNSHTSMHQQFEGRLPGLV